jgi:hypothetical protein
MSRSLSTGAPLLGSDCHIDQVYREGGGGQADLADAVVPHGSERTAFVGAGAKEITVQLGLGTTSAKVEGVRSKARRAGGARVARAGDVGDVQRRPAARGRARRRVIRVIIDHRIIASLAAGNVS